MKEKSIDTAALALLARLELTDAEHQRMAREIGEFADFAAVLSSLDGAPKADACEPLEACNCRDDVAALYAEKIADGYVSVPLTVGAEQ